jgi:uncharacterized protein YkwD
MRKRINFKGVFISAFLPFVLIGCIPQEISPTPTRIQSTPVSVPTSTLSPAPTMTPTVLNGEPTNAPSQPPMEEPLLEATTTKNCVDTAGFFGDVTVPDGSSFEQNQPFTKTWRIRNEGTCTWNESYALVFHSGDILNGALSNPLPAAKPGEIVDVSVNLRSPATGGEFIGYWQFQDPYGKRFGVGSSGVGLIWVKIGVSWYPLKSTEKSTAMTSSAQPIQNTPAPSSDVCSTQQNAGYIGELLQLINNARQQESLPALVLNDKLVAAANAHSIDMACQDFVDHTGSDGSSWYTRIQAQGYNYAYATENIYVGNPAFGGTPTSAFAWWMNSQVHRNNILSPKMTEIGIGYAYSPSSSYGGYYTLVLAKPK